MALVVFTLYLKTENLLMKSAYETVQETQARMLNKQHQIPIKQEVEAVQTQKNSPVCYFCGGSYSRRLK